MRFLCLLIGTDAAKCRAVSYGNLGTHRCRRRQLLFISGRDGARRQDPEGPPWARRDVVRCCCYCGASTTRHWLQCFPRGNGAARMAHESTVSWGRRLWRPR
ncbi:hypothetical protein MTO96_004236 [Rhipicephalus appendiculatus]